MAPRPTFFGQKYFRLSQKPSLVHYIPAELGVTKAEADANKARRARIVFIMVVERIDCFEKM
jgi:hypothetical protein